jgi:hypothetical protein
MENRSDLHDPLYSCGFQRDLGGARYRVRTCLQPQEISGSPGDDSQIDSQSFDQDPELSKIVAAWPKLSTALRAAIMAIVNSAD